MTFICLTLLTFNILSQIKIHHSHIKAWSSREQGHVGVGDWLDSHETEKG